jgi:hypothetical protein
MSDKSKKYLSKYSNGKLVSAAQYITEIICEKKAKQNNQDLHYRFWLRPEWEKFYKNQISSAYALIKKYPELAIIKALNNPKAAKIYSLRAPHLPPIIEQENQLIQAENKELSLKLERPSSVSFVKNKKVSNILSKLKDIDNES